MLQFARSSAVPDRRYSSLLAHLQAHDPLLIHVLTIVVAHELNHLVIWHAAVCQRVGKRLLERHRILDRDLIVQDVGSDESYPFRDAHLIAVGYPGIAPIP